MLKLIVAGIGHIASYATLLALYLTIIPPGQTRPDWHWASIAAASAIMLGTMIWDLKVRYAQLPHRYKNSKAIRRYMNRWLLSGGRAISLSRDLSWVDAENEQVLTNKAGRNELTLCVEKPTELTQRLSAAGAKIYYYGTSGYVPKSRFTIVDFQRDGARVAVGVNDGSNHVIQEFRSGHHPLYAIAEDLVNVLAHIPREHT